MTPQCIYNCPTYGVDSIAATYHPGALPWRSPWYRVSLPVLLSVSCLPGLAFPLGLVPLVSQLSGFWPFLSCSVKSGLPADAPQSLSVQSGPGACAACPGLPQGLLSPLAVIRLSSVLLSVMGRGHGAQRGSFWPGCWCGGGHSWLWLRLHAHSSLPPEPRLPLPVSSQGAWPFHPRGIPAPA